MSGGMPEAVAIAINDMLDNCARIQPGQHVLILGVLDGLYGGVNLVDEQTLAWIQAAVQLRGAHPTVMWTDMPIRPSVLRSDTASPPPAWRIPPVVEAAMKSADVFISHSVDLSVEEELKQVQQILRECDVQMVRNMATTAPLLASAWAQTPWELVSELRFQTASLLKPGAQWTITHPNGTHLSGTVDEASPTRPYASRRERGRPFPEGVFPGLITHDAEGELVFEATNPIWARHIGAPPRFSTPVRLTVRGGLIRSFEGGAEADILGDFYRSLAKQLGDAAYQIRGAHGGVHPHAQVSALQCPDAAYRQFIEHHHWSSMHLHLGNSQRNPEYPYNLHVTAELRRATVRVGDQLLWEQGRLTACDHPEVRAIAARHPGRPGLDAELWA